MPGDLSREEVIVFAEMCFRDVGREAQDILRSLQSPRVEGCVVPENSVKELL